MKPPFVKFIRLELLALSLVVVVGIVALVKKSMILILFCLVLLGFSLLFKGLIDYYTYQYMEAAKQVVKALMLFLFTVYILFAI